MLYTLKCSIFHYTFVWRLKTCRTALIEAILTYNLYDKKNSLLEAWIRYSCLSSTSEWPVLIKTKMWFWFLFFNFDFLNLLLLCSKAIHQPLKTAPAWQSAAIHGKAIRHRHAHVAGNWWLMSQLRNCEAPVSQPQACNQPKVIPHWRARGQNNICSYHLEYLWVADTLLCTCNMSRLIF